MKFIDILFGRVFCRSNGRRRGSASDHFGTRPGLERRTSITVGIMLLINRHLIATESDRRLTRSQKKSSLFVLSTVTSGVYNKRPRLPDFRVAVKKLL